MGQKIFPRSLRTQKKLSQDFSLFSETTYPTDWAKTYLLNTKLLAFSQQNLLYKIKRKTNTSKRKKMGKKRKFPNFLISRNSMNNLIGTLKLSPILLKYAHKSIDKKYNPIKSLHKIKRSNFRVLFQKYRHKSPNKKRNTRSNILLIIIFSMYIIPLNSFYENTHCKISTTHLFGKMAEGFIAPTWKVGSFSQGRGFKSRSFRSRL